MGDLSIMLDRGTEARESMAVPRWRKAILPFVGLAALLGGVGYVGKVYLGVNTETTTADGHEMGIFNAARGYLGPDGNDARCADEKLADISRKVAAIPDKTAENLLESGALEAQAGQFNSLGANGVTARDLYTLLTSVPQTPDTQCNREGGTSTSELLTKAPRGAGAAILGMVILAFCTGKATVRRRFNK